MSSMLKSVLLAAVSIAFLCAALTSNSNASAAKPAAVAPTADELLALDKQATEAYINGNGQFFEGLLSEKIVMTNDGHRMGKADVIKMIRAVRCNIKDWSLTEPHMERINDDTYVLSYKATMDGTCTSDGKTDQPQSPVRAATVKNGRRRFMART